MGYIRTDYISLRAHDNSTTWIRMGHNIMNSQNIAGMNKPQMKIFKLYYFWYLSI